MNTRLCLPCLTLAAAFALGGCGKKETAPPPTPAKAEKVNVESMLGQPASAAEAVPAPPVPEAPPMTGKETTPQPAAEAANQGAVHPKREDMIEKWLERYQQGDAAQKAQVVKEVRAANLTAAEKALMENTRGRYGYARIPLN